MTTLSVSECIKAGYSSIIIQTAEETRAICECLKAGKECNKKVFSWSCTKGIEQIFRANDGEYTTKTNDQDIIDPRDAMENCIQKFSENKNGVIFCLLDFHHYLSRADVLRASRDAFKMAGELGICFVFISNKFEIPGDWEEEVVSISLALPNKDELANTLTELVETYRDHLKIDNPNELGYLIDKAAETALGLTITQAENAFATSISKKQTIDLGIISEVKAQIICKDGLLEFWNNEESVNLGGMHNLRNYTQQRLLAYSDKAQEYGLPYPKGVLLVGIPGCGKSLAAKALAFSWKVPLIKFDIGKLFTSFVGNSESNTREALATAEAMSPCVLWIDEIEKGLAGAESSGKNDSGVASRVFGTILTWMQEKKKPVYVVATANNITSLPQELLRKGRFDEIFFVDLPNEHERKEIVTIQIKKKGRNPENFDIQKIAEQSEGFTGAEIEETIVSAMFSSYADNVREMNTDDIIQAMETMVPASKGIMNTTVDLLRNWAKDRGVLNANSVPKKDVKNETETTSKRNSRKIHI